MTNTAKTPPSWMFHVQPGKFDVRILNQTAYWITRDARILPISNISPVHIIILITMIELTSYPYHAAAILDALIDLTDNLACGQPSADLLDYQLTGKCIGDATSEQWLESTPLMRRLRQILKKRIN